MYMYSVHLSGMYSIEYVVLMCACVREGRDRERERVKQD